jgi:hypothetical protein
MNATHFELGEKGLAGLITPERATELGIQRIHSESTERIGIMCGGINERFKEIVIESSAKEISRMIDLAFSKSKEEQRTTWKKVLLNLLKYSNEELKIHFINQSQEWVKWCNDVLVFYSFNVAIFKKGVPAITLNDESAERLNEGKELRKLKAKIQENDKKIQETDKKLDELLKKPEVIDKLHAELRVFERILPELFK